MECFPIFRFRYLLILSVLLSFFPFVQVSAAERLERNPSVRTVLSRKGRLSQWIYTSGFVIPKALITVTSLSEGDASDPLFETGDPVKKGQILVALTNTLLESDVARKKALLEGREAILETLNHSAEKEALLEMARSKRDYLVSLADLSNARMEYDGKKALGLSGMLAGQELELARAAYEKARASVDYLKAVFDNRQESVQKELWKLDIRRVKAERDSSAADLKSSSYLLDSLSVTSPITGKVVSRLVERGSHVRSGAELYKVADTSSMYSECYLDERSVQGIVHGQEAQLNLIDGETSYDGTVEVVSPGIIPEKGGHLVKILINNSDHLIHMGAYLSVRIRIHQKTGVIVLPVKSVVSQNDEKYVYVVTPQKTAIKRPITTGIEENGVVEIVTGLSSGEAVIVDGVYNVKDGGKVVLSNGGS